MRPLKLTIQAFGSYGEKTEIDFTAPAQNLFLITGDTGSGKTTIFDAIVFALYGEASSENNRKNGAELQSQFAAPGTDPFVELLFSEGNRDSADHFLVHRVPRHFRPRKRGTGKPVEQNESVSLILPDGTEYALNKKETDEKLEEIIGLTKAQFMQVAMIAQGEFMEFLRADSNKKKDIFRKLFGTGLYGGIVEELKNRRAGQLSVLDKIQTACQTLVSRISVPDSSEEGKLLNQVKQRILEAEKMNVTDLETLMSELEDFCSFLKKDFDTASRLYEEKQRNRDKKRDALVHAKNLLHSFEQLEAAEQTLSDCKAVEQQMMKAAGSIVRIRSAYEIRGWYQRSLDAERSLKETETGMTAWQSALPELTADRQKKEEEEKQARRALDTEMESYAKTEERVQKALSFFEEIQKREKDVKEKTDTLHIVEKAAVQAEESQKELEGKIRQWRRQSQELMDIPSLVEVWKQNIEETERLKNEIVSVRNAEKDLVSQRKKVKRAQEKYLSIAGLFQEKQEEFNRKQRDFLDAQAGLLAAQLRPGEPCPVCGSLHHPNPCQLSGEHQELTRDQLDALSAELAGLNEKQNQSATQAGSAAELLKEKESRFDAMMKELRQQIDEDTLENQEAFSVDRAEALVSQRHMFLQAEGKELKEKTTKRQELLELLRNADERSLHRQSELETKRQGVLNAKTELAAAEAALNELEGQKEYSTKKEARDVLVEATESRDKKRACFRLAQEQAGASRAAEEKAMTLIHQFQEILPLQTAEYERRSVEYRQALREKRITEAEWQQIVEEHDQAEAEELQQKLDEYTVKKAAAEGARDTARKTIGEQARPDIRALESAGAESEKQLLEAAGRLEELKEWYRVNVDVYQSLSPRMEERSRITREFSRLDSLYSRLAGKNTGSRMDIETFVQRYYLQRILYAANLRFREMSAGQFELRMVGEDRAGEGKNRGLDLMVYSTVTGKEREIRTLSGGESFMAALSLALGMADQIQENSASIHLDMMFIDEGFGSLDDHSREQAVRVLQQMAGGSKLIGIISHVSELKQEIEDQLVVSKDENGSRVRWQIS